ncbi:MAG: FHA domain-containing protein [Pyrinomonadaceae bacterium]
MSETPQSPKQSVTPDWLVQGVLAKVGDIFDRLLGRGWKPSSTLATSELIERLKALLDSEVRENAANAKFVPHNIKLKMQWDKFSTDSEDALRKLENELLAAAVDHINDRRYYTHAPLSIEVKPDYFTSGVKLYVSFDKFVDDGGEAEMGVDMPGVIREQPPDLPLAKTSKLSFEFTDSRSAIGRSRWIRQGKRLSVGRTKENDIVIDDASVSKVHASITINALGRLAIADTGSTNGTFVNGVRIAYGKAVEIDCADLVKFGSVDVTFRLENESLEKGVEPTAESYKITDFEFAMKNDTEAATDETGSQFDATEI